MLDADTDLINVLEQQIAEIVATMQEINESFSKRSAEFRDQRHVMVTIEASTATAVAEMQDGNAQLEQATENQKTQSNHSMARLLD
jgi:hypothetical protein